MAFLEVILKDLTTMDIQYEEHFNPDGTQLFELYLRESHNPFLIFVPKNPNHALISLSVDYPLPILENITNDNRDILDAELKKLGSELFAHYKIGLLHDSLYFSSGVMLISHDYNPEAMKSSVMKLIDSHNKVIDVANEMLHNIDE